TQLCVYTLAIALPFLFYSHARPPYPHSFPTRRSSDLLHAAAHGAPYPVFGLTSVLDAGVPLPHGLEQTVAGLDAAELRAAARSSDRKSTRLNSSHVKNSYAVFCLKKKIKLAFEQVSAS